MMEVDPPSRKRKYVEEVVRQVSSTEKKKQWSEVQQLEQFLQQEYPQVHSGHRATRRANFAAYSPEVRGLNQLAGRNAQVQQQQLPAPMDDNSQEDFLFSVEQLRQMQQEYLSGQNPECQQAMQQQTIQSRLDTLKASNTTDDEKELLQKLEYNFNLMTSYSKRWH